MINIRFVLRQLLWSLLLLSIPICRSAELPPSAGVKAGALRAQILQMRPPPLKNLNVQVHLNVRDFGAVPDDGKDDGSAVMAVVAKASSNNAPVQIDFDPGTYDFMPVAENVPGRAGNAAVLLRNCANLVIDGHGAELLIHQQDISAFQVLFSTNVIIRNFSVDYDPLPFSQGTVQSVDTTNGTFVFDLQAGFPAPDDPFFKSCRSWGMLKDVKHPGRLKANCPNVFFYKNVQALNGNSFRFELTRKPQIDNFAVGDVFVMVGRSASIGRYSVSENITFDHITVYACPSALFVGSQTSLLNVLNCRAVLKGDRLITAGADGVHCQAARIGPWVENCDFEGLSDDCLNIYGLPIYILKQESSSQLKVHSRAEIRLGDHLVFFNPQSGRIIRETTVKSFSGNTLELTDPIDETLHIAPAGTPMDERGWKIYDHFYNLDAIGNDFVYRNNVMHDGRRYGIFIKASNGLIENNRFEGLSSQAMEIANDPAWPEGFWSRNLVIQNNRVSECGYGNDDPCAVIASLNLNGDASESIQKNIILLNNEFHAVSGPALKVNGADDLVVESNQFYSGSTSGPLITVRCSKNAVLTNNLDQGRVQFQ